MDMDYLKGLVESWLENAKRREELSTAENAATFYHGQETAFSDVLDVIKQIQSGVVGAEALRKPE